MPKKLFLIDGMALIYRAYFAFIRNPRITSSGEDVSAIFGFLNTLFDIQKKHEPTHLAVALDRSEPTFRHVIFPEYKANRMKHPSNSICHSHHQTSIRTDAHTRTRISRL